MKADLLRRVERMEQKDNTSEYEQPWFILVVSPGEIGKPVKGWSFKSGTEQVEILRQDGEADEELATRAAANARAYLGECRTPVLISVSENDLKCL